MRLVVSDAAERDLEEIGDYIAVENPAAARRVVRELRERCALLLDFPRAAPARFDVAEGLFIASSGNYRIAYRILGDIVRIERVLHGARDLGRIEFGRE
jgi:toxin ParE1/3/4